MIVSGVPLDGKPAINAAISMLARRKYFLALSTAAGLAMGIAGYVNTPSSFVSEAVVALDVRRLALPTETVISPLPQDSPVLRTELDLINSRSMAAKVVARLEGEGISIRAEDEAAFSLGEIRRVLRTWLQASAEPSAPPEDAGVPEADRYKVDRLLSRLRVVNDGRSYTIFLSFSSSDPVFAAKVANAYALTYLDHQIDVQRTATRRVSDWLGETLVSLRAELETSEQAAEDFRQKAGLIETDGNILQAQRVSALNNELAALRASSAGMQARLETIKALTSREDFPSLSEILGSPTVQTLRIEQARIERRIRELEDSKAVKSPEIATLRSEHDSIKRQIQEEIARIVASLSNEISIADEKEKDLKADLHKAERDLSQANHAQVTLAQLEREAAANRTIYESYLVRYKQTIEQEGIAVPEAQIISFAEPASSPAKPRLAAWVMFGLGLGGGFGVAGTILRESFGRRPRLVDTIEARTGVPVLCALPRLTRGDRDRTGKFMRDTATRFGRGLLMLRKRLQIAAAKKPAPAFLVTSAAAGEGKTTIAIGLAQSAAAAGMKAVVVDADLRRPGLAAATGVRAQAFLDEHVLDGRGVNEVLHEVNGSGVWIVPARKAAATPELVLASPRFRMLVNELRTRFDLVVIDSPELTAAPDAMEIAAAGHRVLFVVDADATRVERVTASIRTLAAGGREVEGIVLNRLDRRSFSATAERLLPTAVPRTDASAGHDNTLKLTA